MATSDQLKALIRSHADGDDTRFYSVALQLAASEASGGHTRVANELRELVDKAKARRPTSSGRPTPLAQPRGELASLLHASYAGLRMNDLVVSTDTAERLARILHEQRQREELQAHGFHPVRKILLAGPPGTGKTMTASVLAGELALPLFVVRLDALITKFLGETAAKLRLVFDAIGQTRGVYLFDEFDGLASERSAGSDVGEMRRVVNSFLQFLEQDQSDSLIVAATNHLNLLDPALFRRFDAALTYQLPGTDLAEKVMQTRLALLDTSKVDWPCVATDAARLSQAEIVRSCEAAAKAAILAGHKLISTADLMQALSDRRSIRPG